MGKLTDKVAVLTGAAGGLGLCFVEDFLNAGATVVLTDIVQQTMEQAQEYLGDKYAGRFKIYPLDVTKVEAIRKLMQQVYQEFGRIDILVNVAGGSLFTPKSIEDIQEEHWHKVLDVNLKGTFFCSQAVIPYMKQHNYGRIINLSSIGGRTASVVTGCPYAAAKGGVISLTRRMAAEIGKYGITVNAIAPGTILSGERMINLWNELNEEQKDDILRSIPLGRLSTAQEQATVVTFLASDEAAYITGSVIDINGGRFMG